ncbi:MAG: prepilin-type N-terminal cleavage/methylation domain-containing protein [Patescibacteria group bacterium]|jgi:prepilin-type N-terminal cleavage/methylation domain-containing protein
MKIKKFFCRNKNKKNKRGFNLIELLFAIIIIGVISTLVTISVKDSRAKSRDLKRVADVKQIQTALRLYFNDNGAYPASTSVTSSIRSGNKVYMEKFPQAPIPPDGDCDEGDNQYVYSEGGEGNASYTLSFCVGAQVAGANPGNKCATPMGILNVNCAAQVNCLEEPESCSWEIAGGGPITSDSAWGPNLFTYNNDIYVGYGDKEVGYKATVKKYNRITDSWDLVGNRGFSAHFAAENQIFVYEGTPYIAFQDGNASNKATVMKLNGSSWENVGSAGFSAGAVYGISLYVYSGTPYVAYRDEANANKATVMKFNGSSWENVGSAGFSVDSAYFSTANGLYVYNGTPYVGFRDIENDGKVSVMKFNGSSWEYVGTAGFSSASSGNVSLSLNSSGVPYVVYTIGNALYSMKYNGSSWENVGAGNFTSARTYHLSLRIFDDVPYISFQDENTAWKATFMRFNGTSWETLGTAGFSATSIDTAYFTIYNNTPYVVYSSNTVTASVKRLVEN